MKPFIKWPGGKSGEIRYFLSLIPSYDRYIEPFVGGGALYFHLNPEKACINDTSEELMCLYRLIKEQDPEFHRILDLYARSFSALKQSCERAYDRIHDLYRVMKIAEREEIDVRRLKLHTLLVSEVLDMARSDGEPVLDPGDFREKIARSVEDKIFRTIANEKKKAFTPKDLKANLITGFMSGFYLYFRDVFNEIRRENIVCSEQFRAANYYFIREYCYGSMFRYNADGGFNIPYGGISYNKKDLQEKVNQMFSPEMASLLDRTELYCMDFEEMLNSLDLTENDFLFLDPPYDTTFSEYEGIDFNQDDHRRLADYLKSTRATFLLVIKNTEYIRELYKDRFRVLSFENRYGYNVRSRNERKSEHLIITNIPEGEVPWYREVYTV